MKTESLERTRKGIENALLHHIAPKRFPLKEIGRPYQYVTPLTLLSAARRYLCAQGVDAGRISDENVAMLVTLPASGFAQMLADIADTILKTEARGWGRGRGRANGKVDAVKLLDTAAKTRRHRR